MKRRIKAAKTEPLVSVPRVDRRQALLKLGVDALADALLELAPWNKEVHETIERLISGPQKNIERFKNNLANLSCMDEFIDWRKRSAFVRELEFLLEDLKASITDGRTGFELVVSFYETEQDILDNCDDDGPVGNIFQSDAVDLLGHFGVHCTDKDWMCDELLRLYKQNDYGVRSNLFNNVSLYLPEKQLRQLVNRLGHEQQNEPQDYVIHRWALAIESIARQIKDPVLFEQARRSRQATLSADDICDIAQVRFDAGDAQSALSLLQETAVPSRRSYESDQLLLAIHKKLNNAKETSAITWSLFRRHRNLESLDTLLEVIGTDQRPAVICKETQKILSLKELSYTDAKFLISCGLIDEAEQYIWKRTGQLKNGFYGDILDLAETMQMNRRFLIATILYRALLDAILVRAYAKAYYHGVDYLQTLDAMAKHIEDWDSLVRHTEYVQELRMTHKRKSSFWMQYEDGL